ncbi:MAG: hypothetical protein LBT05_03255 [Planctomycetaceae bacterium]|nr:hypothetical protein [Planctomycetaceae bacterium]
MKIAGRNQSTQRKQVVGNVSPKRRVGNADRKCGMPKDIIVCYGNA